MTETSDPQLQLKKRARRRLVGAVAFAGLAAVILPMVMDEEPKQTVRDIQIKIPGQDQPPFKPRDLAARSSPTTVASGGEPLPTPDPAKNADSPPVKPSPAASDALPALAAGAAAVAAAGSAGKPADKPGERTVVAAPEKPVDKKATKAADKAPERGGEKPLPKKTDKPGEKSSGERMKPSADEAQRASALLSGKASEAAPAKTGTGRHVIAVGAFANPENARQLQARLAATGVSAYTEVLDTPDGKKTRVRAGPFPNREAAEKALEKMKRIGVNGVVAGRQ